jgi:hypothetical protein
MPISADRDRRCGAADRLKRLMSITDRFRELVCPEA